MSVKINHDLCIGCGTCEVLCPAVFKLNVKGKADVVSQEQIACAKNAAENCPMQAIEINPVKSMRQGASV
ncbi:ferredoxin [Patescibacteria group bacterium]|nr:ferredoxin [Patescibacteria group bacterium]MBU1663575.1 ferredoxin [Patescibacteria group bacterium]MBU1934040.1 ferredoxin [Patescibacteria group bacterium]MBU2007980.1 ferredoxin [Patescibacteria group bacterium]MBU2264112.1 ferredoxin [Patescibacteria group bacterium]